MDRKIVFFGTHNIGKTTLIEIFFEGKNIFQLLENPLPPTINVNTKIVKVHDNFGVFDLPGQTFEENIKEQPEVFYEADVLILMVDCTEPEEVNVKFVKKAIEARNEYCESAFLYVFYHKKDLISKKKRKELEKKLNDFPIFSHKLAFYSTSIRTPFQMELLEIMIEIIRKLSHFDSSMSYDLDVLRMSAIIFDMLKKQNKVSLNDFLAAIQMNKSVVEEILNSLKKKQYISITNTEEVEKYYLTEKGLDFTEDLSRIFKEQLELTPRFFEELLLIDIDEIKEEDLQLYAKKLVYGMIIMDNQGSMFLIKEMGKDTIKRQFSNHLNINFSLELVSLYIVALTKFSQEIQMELDTGFVLEKKTLRMQMITEKELNFVFFFYPTFKSTLIDEYLKEIKDFFLHNHSEEIEKYRKIGMVGKFFEFKEYLHEKFLELTKKAIMQIQLEDLSNIKQDIKYYKNFYFNLDNMPETSDFSADKLNPIKMEILEAIIEKDIEKLQELEKKILKS